MSSNMMLTIGAFVLLTAFILSSNKIIIENKRLDYESEYIISAIGLAQSVIDEAKTKRFDEAANPGVSVTLSSLTALDHLGAEAGEQITSPPDILTTGNCQSFYKFDDVDDYNNYTRSVKTPRAGGYLISVKVRYVTLSDPEAESSTKTFAKKMTVSVTSPYIEDPVVLNYIFTF